MVCQRVVIDTNIIVSALLFGGRISMLRLAWQEDTSLIKNRNYINTRYPKHRLCFFLSRQKFLCTS